MEIRKVLRDVAASLAGASDTPRLDAELLMAHAMDVTRSELLLRHLNDPVPDGFTALLKRRLAHEPVAYILGDQEFYGLLFTVSSDVLIPRNDSEVLVEAALADRPEALDVLDCGTGSGALLLAVLSHLPGAKGIGIDRSHEALRLAAKNAASLGISRATFLKRDWAAPGWSDNIGTFDLILANPPYVETGAELDPSVSDYEPVGALFAGPQGLDAYRLLLPQLPALLRPKGAAFVEIGASQAETVSEIAGEAGFRVDLQHDFGGMPRVLRLLSRR